MGFKVFHFRCASSGSGAIDLSGDDDGTDRDVKQEPRVSNREKTRLFQLDESVEPDLGAMCLGESALSPGRVSVALVRSQEVLDLGQDLAEPGHRAACAREPLQHLREQIETPLQAGMGIAAQPLDWPMARSSALS
jgi:hypothetical protein